MTPISDNSPLNQFNFGNLKGRKITANFSGGRITSDAGIIWLAELDKKLKITEKFADCFQDHRHLSFVDYPVHQLLAQRFMELFSAMKMSMTMSIYVMTRL
jgi:hypothetical protein